MVRPPRNPTRPLLTARLIQRMVLVAVLLLAATWILFSWERGDGATLDQARTAAVNLFVAVSVLYLFSCRSLSRPAWRLGMLSNRWLLVGVAVQVGAQLALTYFGPLQSLFHTAPLGGQTWLRVLALAAFCAGVINAEKAWRAAGARPDGARPVEPAAAPDRQTAP